MAEHDESRREQAIKMVDEEELPAARDADGDEKTKKVEEFESENVEKMEEAERGSRTREMEVDSPSSVDSSSSFNEERDALRDLKSNEKMRLSQLKERVAEVFDIDIETAEDEDAKENEIGESNRENEEKVKETDVENKEKKEMKVDLPSQVDEKSAFSEMKAEGEDDETKTKEIEESNKEMEVGNEEKNKKIEVSSPSQALEKSSSFNEDGRFKEESNLPSDLKENEKKALADLKAKVEEAILQNKIFNKEQAKSAQKEGEVNELKEKSTAEGEEKAIEESHRDVTLWGVPLLPSKGAETTDVLLLKFLRAQEFNVDEALEMLKNTLKWRVEYGTDSILDEDLGLDFSKVAYMEGKDHGGHPVCYNIYGVFDDQELYRKTFGAEANCKKLLRWRVQLMEREIKKLNFEPGGISSFLQINDLRSSPGLSKKELRQVMKQAITLLQDNYPEFVSTNVSFVASLQFHFFL